MLLWSFNILQIIVAGKSIILLESLGQVSAFIKEGKVVAIFFSFPALLHVYILGIMFGMIGTKYKYFFW